MDEYDVIVIGGGISGLSSGKLLKEHGMKVAVLEARDRVGGRTWTIRDPAFGYTDIGGAYIGPTQRRVARMARELGLEFYHINNKEKTIMALQGGWINYYGTLPPIWNPIVALDMNNFQRTVDDLAKEVPPEAPWKAKRAAEFDTMTVKEFVDKICWTQHAKSLARILTTGVFCAEPHELSLLFFLWYVASGQGIVRLTTIKNGAQERKFVGGAMQLSERMADKLGDGVRLSSPVINVSQSESSVTVHTAHGKVYKAKFVISAIPVALLNRVTFEPALPALKLQLIQRVPLGSIIKTMTFYDKTYWKDKGFSGETITDEGPILYCVDDTKPDGKFPCIMGFILADHARELVKLTPDQRKEAIAKHYAKIFKCEAMLKPVNYVEKNWMEEEYSGGCYVCNMPPGVVTKYAPVMQEPFDKVYFAGTECASYWAGYMEGAIQAGERAARQILNVLGKISVDEIDKPEPPDADFPEHPVQYFAIEKALPSVTGLLKSLVGIGVAVTAILYAKLYM